MTQDQRSADYSSRSTEQLDRDRSAMVLAVLEQSLGELFDSFTTLGYLDEENPTVEHIRAREASRGNVLEPDNARRIVESSFFSEAMVLALEATKNRPEHEHLEQLQKLFDILEIPNIRNAVAHPNRPFPNYYWHRVASVASDPAITHLRLEQVSESLQRALSGRIETPSRSWIERPLWELPNNLPKTFDHTITGLIGRSGESELLRSYLKNDRLGLIALVGPGGLGKTALLLEVLRQLSRSPEFCTWVDKIFYISSKTEELTTEGIRTADAAATTLQEVKDSIRWWLATDTRSGERNLDRLIAENAETRILLCLDNLETLLRDDPSEFSEFHRSLPRNWKVVVTSRVPVSTAETISLTALTAEGSRELAARYLRRRGMEPLSKSELSRISDRSDGNPLAIRLTLDLFRRAGSLEEAMAASRQSVLEFSYTSLLHHLSDTERLILECLRLAAKPLGREQVRGILDDDLDRVAPAFRALTETTLVSRAPSDTEDLYFISSSVRDLLLLYPADTQAQERVLGRMRKLRAQQGELLRLQEERQVTPLHWHFVPEDSPESSRILAFEAAKLLGHSPTTGEVIQGDRRAKLFELVQKLRQAADARRDDRLVRRFAGVALIALGDPVQGKDYLRSALDGDTPDPAAALFLAHQLRDDNELADAIAVSQLLLDLEWDNPERSSPDMASEVLRNHWLSQIWDRRISAAISGTAQWKTAGPLRTTLGSLHALAWLRHAQYEEEPAEIELALLQGSTVLEELIRLDGYVGLVVKEGLSLVDQIAERARKPASISDAALSVFTRFVDSHLLNLLAAQDEKSIDDFYVRSSVIDLMMRPEKSDNFLNEDKWRDILGWIDVARHPDAIIAFITNRPRFYSGGPYKSYFFAQTKAGEGFFVPKSVMQCSSLQWDSARRGDSLALIPGSKPPGKELPPARRGQFLGRNGAADSPAKGELPPLPG